MAAPKPTSIDAYISGFPEDIKTRLEQIRETIQQAAPEVVEKVSYGIPAFELNGVTVWFAAYKKHIGLYPMYGLAILEEEIAPYRDRNTKDSLHFPYTQPLPLELIAKVVKYKLHHL